MSRAPSIALLVLAACGRTPMPTGPELFVQVVDEGDNAVDGADVALVATDPDAEVSMRARTDGYGIATFRWPGDGEYALHAETDLRCCIREGDATVTIVDPSRVVVVETVTGPCPVWVPTDC